jgi:RNA polymerase sigma-70 factor (ECF subfamily)
MNSDAENTQRDRFPLANVYTGGRPQTTASGIVMLNLKRTNSSRTGRSLQSVGEQEAEMVARAKVDSHAFAPLYTRYLDTVYRCCYRRLGNREAAEDATSEVFYKALAALPGHHNGSFRAWLMAIAHNVVADSFRRQHPEEPLMPDYDPPDETATPEETALAAEERHSLRALLVRLPDGQRSVLELRLAGLTGPEIATVLGRSLGSVKMLQFRAVAQLRVPLGVHTSSEEAHDDRG